MSRGAKADYIREYLARYPEMGPSELARKITEEHSDLNVRPQEISTMRTRLGMKKNGHQQPQERPPPPSDIDIATAIEKLRKVVNLLGKEQAKKIIDVL